MTAKPIILSGAGIASLLLAQSLRRSKIPFVIFERDASLSFRGQGYRLRLSDEGLDAIESVLKGPAWQQFFDRCGKTAGAGFVQINPITGETLENNMGESLMSRGGVVVGAARGMMREEFLKGCEEYITWSKHVTGYELTEDGVRAVFSDGTKSEEGSMLIGGEGVKSEVAKQLSNGALKVYDTGARGVHGQAPTTAFKGLGEGVFRLFEQDNPAGGSLMVITNVRPEEMNDPDVLFGWTMVGSPGLIKAPGDNYSIVGKEAADLAKKLTSHWHERVKPLFDNMVENEAAFWKITCSTPGGVPDWPNQPRVTVIGDAAHSMTPAGGIGANTAVRDSAYLGKLLGEAGGYKEGVTKDYEKKMREWGSEAVAKSYGLASKSWGMEITVDTPVVSL